ncbi:hypothetical protein [Actinomadura rugatobispora]|uniref:FAD-binding FR-type domain-containing protein n=1 Tax=Actinomadura rugatobispora TaxID=1994 RepID=A0ABW0ZZH2_9ACTN|nr:dihydroorotate dehydrogenase electron transfer subunit [Actinomadura rugatobispora]
MTAGPGGGRLAPLALPGPVAPTWDHAEVVGHHPVGDRYHRMRLKAPTIAAAARAGQFVMVTIPDATGTRAVLPRPMAIHRRLPGEGCVDIVYGVQGAGTRAMTGTGIGTRVQIVGPLGVGFALSPDTTGLLLVGRGIGVCSVTTSAEDAVRAGVEVTAVVSGRGPDALVGSGDHRELGVRRLIEVTDRDGSSAPDALAARLRRTLDAAPPQQIFTCGSERLAEMCARLADRWGARVQVSLEAHMACGLGYCHGCATAARTAADESPLICADGPVFELRPAERAHG